MASAPPMMFNMISPVTVSVACIGALALLGFFSYGFVAYDLAVALMNPGITPELADRDFANYWLAGRLIRSGEYLELFTQSLYFPHMQEAFGLNAPVRNWSYPPHYLLVVWPLGFVGYEVGFVLFHVVTAVIFVAAVVVFRARFAPKADWTVLAMALCSYGLMMFVTAQNGFLTSALLLLGLAWMHTRPILAGLAFALLTVKPQLGLLIPLLLLMDKNWRAIVAAAVWTVLVLALSTALFGAESWRLYLTEGLEYQRYVMTDWGGMFLRMMPTVYGSLRSWAHTPTDAMLAQTVVSVASLALILWLLLRERDPLWRVFVVAAGTFLITPYAFNYDMGALSVCAALLVGRSAGAPTGRTAIVLLTAVAGLAPVVMNLGRSGLPVAPFVLLASLGVAALATRARARTAVAPNYEPSLSSEYEEPSRRKIES